MDLSPGKKNFLDWALIEFVTLYAQIGSGFADQLTLTSRRNFRGSTRQMVIELCCYCHVSMRNSMVVSSF